MTCDDFDHLCDDDNGRKMTDYTDAEIMSMMKHMNSCPRCFVQAMLNAAAFERTRTTQEIAASNDDANTVFNRIVPKIASDPELR